MRNIGLLGLAVSIVACGCSDVGKYVPVSGTIMFDGKPAVGVQVVFQPVSTTGNTTNGVGSFARTDSEGKYTLEASTPTPTPGAAIGKHLVRIATVPPPGDQTSDSAAGSGKAAFKDPIPAKYNVDSTLTFEVPRGGTDKADFDLKK